MRRDAVECSGTLQTLGVQGRIAAGQLDSGWQEDRVQAHRARKTADYTCMFIIS